MYFNEPNSIALIDSSPSFKHNPTYRYHPIYKVCNFGSVSLTLVLFLGFLDFSQEFECLLVIFADFTGKLRRVDAMLNEIFKFTELFFIFHN